MTLASWHLGESWQQGGQGARLSQLIPPEELPSAPSAAGASTPLTLWAPTPGIPQFGLLPGAALTCLFVF